MIRIQIMWGKSTPTYMMCLKKEFDRTVHESRLWSLLRKRKIRFYVGFDPTADCLHVETLIQVLYLRIITNMILPVILMQRTVIDPTTRLDLT